MLGRPPQGDKLERDDSALAEHMKNMHGKPSINDFNNYYKFTIIEIEPKSLNKSEQFWVSRLFTMSPFGLNRERPLGVTDSFLTRLSK